MTERVKSDGGSSAYYELPADAAEIMDLIEARNLPFWQANCLKAIWRIGQKDGVEEEYDLRKIIYFANRRLMQLGKEPSLKEQKTQVEVDFGESVVEAINRRVDSLVEERLNKNAAFRTIGTEQYVLGGHRERFGEAYKVDDRTARADANIAQGLPAEGERAKGNRLINTRNADFVEGGGTYGLIKDLD